jgi:hypothetical protein
LILLFPEIDLRVVPHHMCTKKGNFVSKSFFETYLEKKRSRMKRIKSEEIQNSIKNYVLQRNLPCKNLAGAESSDKTNKTFRINSGASNSNIVDLNFMALNDLSLIESSIYDYYSFSFNSNSEIDYLNQFET